ncbi:MAG TPA: amidohydrolase [Verrucomicrobiaceae bacterium]|jgi:hippurate hydrolase
MKATEFRITLIAALLTWSAVFSKDSPALQEAVKNKVAQEKENLLALYRELHAAPELSFQEEKTSQRMAREMRAAGLEVTEKVGKWGVVAVLKNGPGKTILVRTDMDGLPVRELTGLPFASKAQSKTEEGREVPVMHACGHDVHMTCWVGTARVLASMKDRWHGTLVFIGQPAEERLGGANAMLQDGLFQKFPKPDFGLALHDTPELAVGQFGLTANAATANVDSVDIIVHGLGGHGAMPDRAKDPVVLAAQIVLALQTIRSREISPIEGGAVTVGSIHGGTQHNIIPDEVKLQLTVRTFSAETRAKVLESIARIARGQGISAGMPDELLPEIKKRDWFTPMLRNDPILIGKLRVVFEKWFGKGSALDRLPTTGGEDFALYGMTPDKIPIAMFWLGVTPQAEIADARKEGRPLPSLHSPFFKPDMPNALPVGVTAMSAALLDLLE